MGASHAMDHQKSMRMMAPHMEIGISKGRKKLEHLKWQMRSKLNLKIEEENDYALEFMKMGMIMCKMKIG